MPTRFFRLTTLTQHFEDETFLAEAVNFHEISRFHTKADSAVFNARLNAEQILLDAYANTLHTRIAPENIEIREISIDVAPPKKTMNKTMSATAISINPCGLIPGGAFRRTTCES